MRRRRGTIISHNLLSIRINDINQVMKDLFKTEWKRQSLETQQYSKSLITIKTMLKTIINSEEQELTKTILPQVINISSKTLRHANIITILTAPFLPRSMI